MIKMEDLTEEVKTTTRQLLQSTLFLGTYTERRYIEALNTYRDVVVVADSERDFRRALAAVWARLTQHFGDAVTIGISPPPDVFLHVSFRHGIALGPHWFQVKDLVFCKNGEVVVKLKQIREVENADVTAVASASAEESTVSDISWSEVGEKFRDMLTVRNTIQLIRFTLLLLITAVTALVTVLQATANFSIRFMREARHLLRVSTPLLLGFSDILVKIFGGILILLSMMWKDMFYLARRRLDPEGTPPIPPAVPIARPAIGYNVPSSSNNYNPSFTGYRPFISNTGLYSARRRGQVHISEVQ